MAVSDAELVARVRQGDREAFGELVDHYRDMVYGLGYHLTGDFEAAQDLAQEALVQAFTRLEQLRDAARFGGWLRTIVLNCHRAGARRHRVSTVALSDAAEVPGPERQPSEAEVAVREALGRLRPPERLALTLHYVNGYSHAEIGAFLGVRPEVINTRLARARRHLREEVLAMAEEVFDGHALPPEFKENVVQAVERLVSSFRQVLPADVEALAARLHDESREAWQEIVAQLPAPYGRPLRAQGEAPRARIAELPGDLQPRVRRAACLTWMRAVLEEATGNVPWIRDFDSLWIRFYDEDGAREVWFANTPGNTGYISSVSVEPAEGPPEAPPAAAEVDRAMGACERPEFQELLARLRRRVPGKPGSLAGALGAQVRRLMREVRDQLPAELLAPGEKPSATKAVPRSIPRGALAARSISVRELPEDLRELVRQAVYFYWGSAVVRCVEEAPLWVLRPDESSVEFGLYSGEKGSEYVLLRGAGRDTYQTGIA